METLFCPFYCNILVVHKLGLKQILKMFVNDIGIKIVI